MSDGKPLTDGPLLKQFFWSARALHCETWKLDEELGKYYIDSTEDVVWWDSGGRIFAYEPYGRLITELLNKHFKE